MLAAFLLVASIVSFAGNISKVPLPMELKEGKGVFKLNASTKILADPGNKELRQIAKLIVQKINMAGGPLLSLEDYQAGAKIKNAILLTLSGGDVMLGNEGYQLEVTKKAITIRSIAPNGIFYAIQSLFQLLPPEIERTSTAKTEYAVPVVLIRDKPRFTYRGMHLDVGRHMFPVSFIKKYIDLMAMYKMNTFHWHLTDDQGWRIEIKKYPRLTQVGSARTATAKGKTDELDGIPYGGFYTQEQAREIVSYAASKFVTVIPEIEMPGHSVAALTAYPFLSCTGGPFQVRTSWGVADDILCAGNDSSFIFVQDVLTEVMDLFPSMFIHIGGDEAPKTRWKVCPKCQERMKIEGLKDEMELQSYFIKRVERFLDSKGRRLIGWDEILEGGIAPEATVMSWRGMQGGIDAARQNHDVIMTPTDFCYFDYYQADPATEPLAIGGMLTLKTVYNFEPAPPVLSPEQSKHILGAQGNLWTEYLQSPEMVEYMAYPRAVALSEVNWSSKDARNWDSFLKRMDNQYKRLEYLGVNYSKGSFQVDITTLRDSLNHRNLIRLSSETLGYDIHYTIDGTEPDAKSTRYDKPFEAVNSCTVKAVLVKNGVVAGTINERNINVNLASGKPVKVLKPYSFKYPGTGDQAMTDGILGTASLKSGWQGYEGSDMEAVIDLLQPIKIRKISTTFIQLISSWVLYPIDVEYYTSMDGINWQLADKLHTDPAPSRSKADRDFSVELPGTTARYIKVFAKNNGVLPEWHEYKGQPSWIFADEVRVE
jgi:hexosaminidase